MARLLTSHLLKHLCLGDALPCRGLPWWGGSVIKNPPANAENAGSVPESGRSPGEGNDNPLQYACLGNPMDRGSWRAHEVTKESDTTQQPTKPQQLPCEKTAYFEFIKKYRPRVAAIFM